jgi:hypothetical protein
MMNPGTSGWLATVTGSSRFAYPQRVAGTVGKAVSIPFFVYYDANSGPSFGDIVSE